MPLIEAHSERRPETELLLWAVQEGVRQACGTPIRSLLQTGIDWAYLLQMAQAHGIEQRLYEPLHRIGPPVVPDHILDQLEAYVHNNTAHSFFLTGELIKILRQFESHDIPAIPFKGPTLAVQLYGDVGLRRFGDLDILVRPTDVQRVKVLMRSLQYEPMLQLSVAQENVLLRTENALGFVSAIDNTLVEIHWALSPRYLDCRFRFEDLWASVVPTYPGGREVLTMAPEPLLVFLCVHGAKHQWGALGWVVDIARLIHVHQTIDWDLIMSDAERLGLRRIVCLGLELASTLLGTELPPDVCHWVRADGVVASLNVALCERLFTEPPKPMSGFERFRFYRRIRERPRDRWRYYAHLVMTPSLKDWTAWPLPASLSFLYAVIRPIRLLRELDIRSSKRG